MPNRIRRRRLLNPVVWTPPITNGLLRNFDGATPYGLYTDTAATTPLVSSGQTVGTWRDWITGRNLTATGGGQPTWVANLQNGLGGVQFNGSSNVLLGSDADLPAGIATRTAFFVVNWRSLPTGWGGFSYGTTSTSLGVWGLVKGSSGTSPAHAASVQGWGTDYTSSYAITANVPIIYGATLRATTNIHHFVNGNALNNQATVFNTVLNQFRVGAETASSSFQPINAYQILFYNRAFTDGEMFQTMQGLNTRWRVY